MNKRISKSLAVLSLLVSTSAAAHDNVTTVTYPGADHYAKANLRYAAEVTKSIVSDIAAQIAYIQSVPSAPASDCEFCTDDSATDENDGLVVNHLFHLSSAAKEIGRLGTIAAMSPFPSATIEARQACTKVDATLADLPSMKAALTYAPVGKALPTTFDTTESKLFHVKGLIPNCP